MEGLKLHNARFEMVMRCWTSASHGVGCRRGRNIGSGVASVGVASCRQGVGRLQGSTQGVARLGSARGSAGVWSRSVQAARVRLRARWRAAGQRLAARALGQPRWPGAVERAVREREERDGRRERIREGEEKVQRRRLLEMSEGARVGLEDGPLVGRLGLGDFCFFLIPKYIFI
jgi:hypothetical protein